jgi:hypothetical protein
MLTVDPLIPAGVWITLALAGAALLAVYAWRRPGGVLRGRWAVIIALMSVAFVLVLAVLLNPTWAQPAPPPPGRPVLTILVDSSASMATPDAGAKSPQTRFQAALDLARAIDAAGGGAADVEVRARRFDETLVPGSLDDLAKAPPTGQATDIAGAIMGSVESDRPAGQAVVVLTDGIASDSSGGSNGLRAAARFARASGAPIYSVVLGGDGGGMDLAVEAHTARELAFAGQKVTLVADVMARGFTGKAAVKLLYDGKEIGQQIMSLNAEKGASAQFEVAQPKPGLYAYEMRVAPLDSTVHELTEANNSTLCLLRVIDKAVHVMLVEGKPYWDSKFLTRQLASDPSIEMHSLVQMAAGRVLERVVSGGTEGGAAASDQWKVLREPGKALADTEALKDLQVLILGRDTGEFLSPEAVANIQRWVSREGGALICYRGSPTGQVDQGLARLLPVKWQPAREARYQIKLTDIGKSMDWFGSAMGEGSEGFLAALPPLASDTQVEQTKALAVVVAEAQWQGRTQSPAVTYQPYGAGRVVVIEGAGMWRWAFPPAPGAGDAVATPSGVNPAASDEAYSTLWHALFRWIISGAGLVPGEQTAIRPDKIGFNAREPAAATVLTRAETGAKTPARGPAATAPALSVKITGPQGVSSFPCDPSPDDPSAYRVQFGVLPPGRYVAELVGAAPATAFFDVKNVGEEELNLKARPDVMQMIADESGGAILKPEEAAGIASRMAQSLAKARAQHLVYLSAWDRLWIFAVIMALWTMAWSFRRASGLV